MTTILWQALISLLIFHTAATVSAKVTAGTKYQPTANVGWAFCRRTFIASSILTATSVLSPPGMAATGDENSAILPSSRGNMRGDSVKKAFFDSLDRPDGFNQASKTRTALMNEMTTENPTKRPGSISSFRDIAPGSWRIIYAPHISTLSSVVGGSFDPVLYDMNDDGFKIVSHAKYNFPVLGEGWLSVSGIYDSMDNDRYCKVEFDRAWIGVGSKNKFDSIDDAPETWYKNIINSLGQLGFRKEFAVFPVSYLDEDTIVFDFELLGTRICATKLSPASLDF